MQRRITTAVFSVLSVLTLLPASVVAQQEQEDDSYLALRVGTGNTDNVAAAPAASAESANYLLLGVSAALKNESTRIKTSLNGDMDYGFYSSSGIDNSPMGRLVAGVTLVGVPSVFEWETTDDFGSVRVDLLRAPSALNRQYLNSFETGPNVRFRLGNKTTLNLGSRYQQRRWQQSGQLDQTGLSKTVGIARALSSVRSIGVTATTRRLEYDLANIAPYDLTSVYATYAGKLGGGQLSFDIGRTELELEDRTTDGPFVGLTWNRPLSETSSIYVHGSQKIVDAADQFLYSDLALFASGGNAALTTDPRTRTEWGAGYTLGSRRRSFGVNLSTFKDEQETEFQLNRDGRWIGVDVNHEVGMAWNVGAHIRAGRETLRASAGTTEQREVRLVGSRQFRDALALSIEYGRWTWQSDLSANTTESAVIVALAWMVR